MNICPNCQTENQGSYCKNCGIFLENKLTSQYDPNTPPHKKNSGMIALVIILCAVLAILLGVISFLIVTRDPEKNEPKEEAKTEITVNIPQNTVPSVPQQPPEELPEPVSTPKPTTVPTPKPTPKTSSAKNSYSAQATQIEQYEENIFAEAYSQADINQASATVYNKWDALLNNVYGHLKNTLSDTEFQSLRKSELAWIKEKENAMAQSAAEWEGGTGEPAARYGTGAAYTKDRVYYLISLIP